MSSSEYKDALKLMDRPTRIAILHLEKQIIDLVTTRIAAPVQTPTSTTDIENLKTKVQALDTMVFGTLLGRASRMEAKQKAIEDDIATAISQQRTLIEIATGHKVAAKRSCTVKGCKNEVTEDYEITLSGESSGSEVMKFFAPLCEVHKHSLESFRHDHARAVFPKQIEEVRAGTTG